MGLFLFRQNGFLERKKNKKYGYQNEEIRDNEKKCKINENKKYGNQNEEIGDNE